MTTLSGYGSSFAGSANATWTTTTLAYDNDTTTYAAGSVPTGITAYGEVSGYGFSSISTNAVIDTVTVDAYWNVATANRWASASVQAYVGGVAVGSSRSLTISASTTNVETFQLTGLTLADLRDNTFTIRLTGVRTGTTTQQIRIRQLNVTVAYHVITPLTLSATITTVPLVTIGKLYSRILETSITATSSLTYDHTLGKMFWTGSEWKSFQIWDGTQWSSNFVVWTGSEWV